MSNEARTYDLIIYGATGFTGKLVAEYLAGAYSLAASTDAKPHLRWGIAGREASKLASVREQLGLPELGIVVADSSDAASLASMCSSTHVVCTTVGPYAKYGSAVVAACVAANTDYCDLSGEVPWMHRMIDAHHADAYRNGTRIVHSCGFDSVPSDIGVLHLQQAAKAQFGGFCESVEMVVAAAKGGFSGGTYASLQGVLAEGQADASVATMLANPYSLNAPAPPGLCDVADQASARFSEDLQTWTAPFVMASINTRIVRRSHALQGFPYGRNFCYREATATGPGTKGKVTAKVMSAAIGAVMAGGVVAKVANQFAPDQGEGPSEEARATGYFKLKLVGRTPDGEVIRTTVRGKRDPGYGCTSRMLAESAVALVRTRGQNREGGVVTPAFAIGEELLERLPQHADVTFKVEE